MDWTENNALVDWVTPCSSHIPKASTRLEIRTSVKHGLDQILTSTQPRGSHSCQLLSIDLYGGFVWCHPIPWPVQIHMFPLSGKLETPGVALSLDLNFDFFQVDGDITLVKPVSSIDLHKCVWCHWTQLLFHQTCRVVCVSLFKCHLSEVTSLGPPCL